MFESSEGKTNDKERKLLKHMKAKSKAIETRFRA